MKNIRVCIVDNCISTPDNKEENDNAFIIQVDNITTMKLVDGYSLPVKVLEIDNGVHWLMKIYLYNATRHDHADQLQDVINLEHCRGNGFLAESILQLPVYNENNDVIGTVESRLANALECYVPDCVLSSFEITNEIGE